MSFFRRHIWLASRPPNCWLAGASPLLDCQPWSSAGKQKGHADDRHLWPVFRELVRAQRPPIIFGEQVASKAVIGSVSAKTQRGDGRQVEPVWLDGVFADLEDAHYTCGATAVPAAGIGAPHIRLRTYWVAYAKHSEWWTEYKIDQQAHRWDGLGWSGDTSRLAYTISPRERRRNQRGLGTRGQQMGEQKDGSRVANESGDRCEDAGRLVNPVVQGSQGHTRNGDNRSQPGRLNSEPNGSASASGCACGLGEPDGAGSQPGKQTTEAARHWDSIEPAGGGLGNSEAYGPEMRTQLHEQMRRQGSPERCELDFWGEYEFAQCRDGKQRRVKPGIFPLVNGLPKGVVYSLDPGEPFDPQATAEARVMRLRGYGNSICPQLAAEFIRSVIGATFG